jgi:3'(2'), 5'-bisphosphate nucleotidase
MRAELENAMRRVGAEIVRCREQGNTSGRFEGSQFKAAADLIADRCMREELRTIADLPVISEEDVASHSARRPAEYWLIDPIDGTASFAHGFPGFVCQAALMTDGSPQLAAVYAPVLQQLFSAQHRQGATLNGERIAVASRPRHQLTLVDNYPQPRGIAEWLFRDLRCAHYLESGSIGLKVCLVAAGAADLFVKDVSVRDWDVAAPALILREAGGVFVQCSGQPFEYAGDYQKHGLIAAASTELLNEVGASVARYARERHEA